MSLEYDSEKPVAKQGVYWNEEDWDTLLKKLPLGWQEQAVKLGAWQRVRKLAQVTDLLRGLLVYAACGYTFRELGMWATVVGLGSLSERAWRKRVERAQAWISWVLASLIGTQQSPDWLPEGAGRILLLDGSRLKTPAGSGEDVKMHTAYNLRTGQLESVEVTDRHSAEGVQHVRNMRARDVIVTDAGYQLGSSLQYEQAHGAYGVHRLSASHVRLEREDGKRIDLKRLVKHQRYGTVSQYQVWVWDSKHQERFALRLVIAMPPRQYSMAARARKRARIRQQKGTKASLAPAWWAGVMLVGTTLPQEQWSAQEVVKLYRARWQIELFFKRLKQGLLLHLLPVKHWERAQAYVHLSLIVWALQEQHAQDLCHELEVMLREPEVDALCQPAQEEAESAHWVISHWSVAHWELETVRSLLRGSWTRERLSECLPELRRYLVSWDRQRRPSQEREVQAWLHQQLVLPDNSAFAA
jgi:hypothetical protein